MIRFTLFDVRLLIRGILAAGAVMLALAAPAAAAPTWSAPEPLSEAGLSGQRAVIDARGNALVVWQRHYGSGTPTWEGNRIASSYRWYLPGSGWGPVIDLPKSAGYIRDVAITPRGEAHALVVGTGAELVPVGIWTAAPGGRLSSAAEVTDAAYAGVGAALGLDDRGDAIVAWAPRQQQGQPLYVSIRAAGGAFGQPQPVGELPGGDIEVVSNAAGAAAVKWTEGDGRARVAYRPAGGQFGGEEDPGLGANALSRVALDLDGRVMVSGAFNDGIAWTPGSHVPDAAVAVRSPLGGWSDQQVIEEKAYVSSAVADRSGVATFTLGRYGSQAEADRGIVVTRYPDGRLEREEVGAGPVLNSMAAIDHRGDVLVGASDRYDTADPHVFVRERAAGATAFDAPIAIAPGLAGDVAVPALNDVGQAIVVWRPVTRAADGHFDSGPITAVVRDDPALHPPAPPAVELFKDPLAAIDEDGALRAPVRCDPGCKVSAAGIVFPGGGETAVAGRGPSVRLTARKKTRVKLQFGAQGARAVRDALAAGQRPWVSVTVSGRGRNPRPQVVSRRYKLKR